MKFLFSMLGLFFLTDSSYCQLKQIPVSKIINQQEKSLCCLDSTNAISKSCPLNLDGFRIKFYAAYLDKNKSELQLIGRACKSDEINSPGISELEIFKAKKVDNKIIGRTFCLCWCFA